MDKLKIPRPRTSYTKQQAFNRSAIFIYKQGEMAFDSKDGFCVNYDEKGRRCAVSCLMPIKVSQLIDPPFLDCVRIGYYILDGVDLGLKINKIVNSIGSQFMGCLLDAHDGYREMNDITFKQWWVGKITEIALKYKLENPLKGTLEYGILQKQASAAGLRGLVDLCGDTNRDSDK